MTAFDYDEMTVSRILSAILECPEPYRMNSFAVATDVFVRGICNPLIFTTGAIV